MYSELRVRVKKVDRDWHNICTPFLASTHTDSSWGIYVTNVEHNLP